MEGNTISIQEISIPAQNRRHGIGSQLITKLKELCENEYYPDTLEVFIAPNDDVEIDDLIIFYQSNGFTVTRRLHSEDEADGIIHFVNN